MSRICVVEYHFAKGWSGIVVSLSESSYVTKFGARVVLCSSFATGKTGWGFKPRNLTLTSNFNSGLVFGSC